LVLCKFPNAAAAAAAAKAPKAARNLPPILSQKQKKLHKNSANKKVEILIQVTKL
jgi:hypothetical protein